MFNPLEGMSIIALNKERLDYTLVGVNIWSYWSVSKAKKEAES